MVMIIATCRIEEIFSLLFNNCSSTEGNCSSSVQHTQKLLICWRWEGRTADDEGIECCVNVNDYCLYTSGLIPPFPLPFLSASAAEWFHFSMISDSKSSLILLNGEQKGKKATHYRHFHPEKWNIKRVHYTLNLQLFLRAHSHFPIFPALLLARRLGPWKKSLFHYLNPCTGLSQANHLTSARPLPNSDWQPDAHSTDGEGDNACDKEKISPPRYVFIGNGKYRVHT